MKNRTEDQANFIECMFNDYIGIYEDMYSGILPVGAKIKCVRTSNYNSINKAVRDVLRYCNANDIILLYLPKTKRRKSNEYCMFHVYIVDGLKCTKHVENFNDIADLSACFSKEMLELIDKYKYVRHVLKRTPSALKDEVHDNLIKNYIESGKDLPQEGL